MRQTVTFRGFYHWMIEFDPPDDQKAQEGAQASRLRRGLAEKLGALLHLPGGIRLAHFLTYWPIFLVYFLFELLKAFMANLRKLAVVGASLSCCAESSHIPLRIPRDPGRYIFALRKSK